eukprot:CAMPEP_0172701322 /NCGR_PEP_ID=MMETSP1074-20121228/31556_1 /TAXON_ID=2916 /ORGANISM="Ceratium fusus, Strain PA161109" /LENGTH=69 /DNA_ID=CAMNT_0013522853 /DNA_START=260 /DNA_END=469 /DNA_ORIENTATION=+
MSVCEGHSLAYKGPSDSSTVESNQSLSVVCKWLSDSSTAESTQSFLVVVVAQTSSALAQDGPAGSLVSE